MADVFTSIKRSAVMRAVPGSGSRAEVRVRHLAISLGYRFQTNVNWLPGRPDLVFVARRKVVLVHGCFWHRHSCEGGRSMPTSNVDYWAVKFRRNRIRDRQVRRENAKGDIPHFMLP